MDYNRFEELRAARGITKKYIADALNRKDTICQDWKKGKSTPSQAQLSIIAGILNTTPEYLQGYTDIKEKPTAGAEGMSPTAREIINCLDGADEETLKRVLEVVRLFVENTK